MLIARVSGTIVATQKSENLNGMRLLLLEKLDVKTMKGKNDFLVALDAVGANVGEVVFYVTGSSARLTDTSKGKPTDSTITGIIDNIEREGQLIYRKSEDI
ncbi:MAG: EutN/CcmL family microcompartment protein [Spirochaetaceae bacterium]|jgi:microcompartment protein CcmK/EutM|nr:EutN/CcmL family microcompartment protein [Spirochaetaceae bacterium]